MTDEPLKRCPECRGKVTRLIGTGAGIIFKGSGFYETDYRKKSYKEAASREQATENSSSDKKTQENKNKKPGSGETKQTG
jgi:predicted nucleic acid-binding Zn ribbon protein